MADHSTPTGGFVVGVDLGTTYSAAAVCRGSKVEPFVLGTIAAQIPSVVMHRADEQILVGEAAERRASAEPTRAAREFKRRLGDPIPIIVGGTPYGAESLMAQVLQSIIAQVTEREGQAPDTIVLTHPANYSDYKRGLLHEAARLAGLDLARVRLITEPEAAAIAYAHRERIEDGEIIAVYDFGGGTFDAAVVRGTAEGFQLIGVPEGMERLGGIDVDQAVLAHVDEVLGGMVGAADAADPNVIAGQARLRDECRRAKEALSSDTDATIPVSIPGLQTDVRLTRGELETMVRPRIVETVAALQRTIASAGLQTADVSRVLLVGGTSRMPIVAQTVREMIGRPISVDADPKLSSAIGAALSASAQQSVPAAPATEAPAGQPPSLVASQPKNARAWRPGRVGVGIAAAVVAAIGAVAIVATSGGGSDASDTPASIPAAQGPSTSRAPSATATPGTASPTSEQPQQGSLSTIEFDTGAWGSIEGLAVGPDGTVVVSTATPSLVRLDDGAAAAVPGLPADAGRIGGMAVGSDGTVFVSTSTGVVRITDGQAVEVLNSAASGLTDRLGPVALDGGGNAYIADNGSARIVRLAPDGGLTLVAGTGTAATEGSVPTEPAAAVTSNIGTVVGLFVDAGGHLLIADATMRRIRSVAADGTITTVAGGGALPMAHGAAALDVAFGSIDGLAGVGSGSVLIAADGQIVRIDAGVAMLVQGEGAAPSTGLSIVATSSSGRLVVSDGALLWSIAGDDA